MTPPKSCSGFVNRFLLPVFALGLLLVCTLQAEQALLLHRQSERVPVARGAELIQIRQLSENGWVNISALEIDLTDPDLEIDAILGNNHLTGAQPLSQTASARGAIAGINGDFFHIRNTNAPIGVHIQSGEFFKSPPPGSALSVGFLTENRTPFIGNLIFEGRLLTEDAEYPLNAWNPPAPGPDGIAFYNSRWNSSAPGPNGPDLFGQRGLIHVILDEQKRVTRLLRGKPGPEIPPNGSVLLGRGRGAAWLLKNAQPGTEIEIDWALEPHSFFAAIGGHPLLLRDGEITVSAKDDLHPRTAIGFDPEKTRCWWVVVDGRSTLSHGMTHYEMAALMRDFGASDALNLDGGGSSTLLARAPGTAFPAVQNITSDGAERNIPNGLGLFVSTSSGTMKHLLIQPPPGDPYLVGQRELRLAPSATFQFQAIAADEQLNPVELPGNLEWSVVPPGLGSFSKEGKFSAIQPGRGEIVVRSAENRELTASLPIRIIDEPVELKIEPQEISARTGETVELSVRAVDRRGFHAPLSPNDLIWKVRGNAGTVENGRFYAADQSGSGAVLVEFGKLTGVAPVGVGARPETVSDFQNEADWSTTAVPEETKSALSFSDEFPFVRNNRTTARLTYDFTGTTRIRAAYLYPSGGDILFPGRPLQLGLWVWGDRKEAWLRGQIVDSTGTARAIDFVRNIDWTGWRYVEAEIPPGGVTYPISLRRIYVVETGPNSQYAGEVAFDELLAVYAPDIDPSHLPEVPEVRDPANRSVKLESADENHFRFIVFGDSKVEADDPDSAGATVFSALIDEINRHDEIEFILYTGDLIENDTEANYRFGKQFLDRLKKPYHITVANHEIAGSDNFDRYREFFGETFYRFRHGNSDFFILNSARPGLRESEPEQWPWLQEQLVETDAENIFILTHIPVVDPMPGGITGWSDEGEVAIFQDLLTQQTEKGRNVFVFHGHVHGFNRRPHDGVEYLISAGGGSPLYLPPNQGGFYHYTIVTVADTEISYQVIPLLERIDLPATIEAVVGETVSVQATGIAPDELVAFPLRYPAASEWQLADKTLASFDPEAGRLRALSAGETTLTVKSGGIEATARVIVKEPQTENR